MAFPSNTALKCSRTSIIFPFVVLYWHFAGCGSFVHKDCVSSLDPVCLAKETMAVRAQENIISGFIRFLGRIDFTNMICRSFHKISVGELLYVLLQVGIERLYSKRKNAQFFYSMMPLESQLQREGNQSAWFSKNLFYSSAMIDDTFASKIARTMVWNSRLYRNNCILTACTDTPNALLITHGQQLSTLFFESDEVKDAWLNDITMSIKAKRTSLTLSQNSLEWKNTRACLSMPLSCRSRITEWREVLGCSKMM